MAFPSPRPEITVSAPGKLILAGEHAAVYGRPALVAAVDARLAVRARDTSACARPRHDEEAHAGTLESEGAPGVVLELADLGIREHVTGAVLREYAERARERWRSFAESPTPERFRTLRGGDAAHLVKVALGETLLRHGAGSDPRWTLHVESKIPVGSGMGSSAAAAAALVTAGLRLLGHAGDLAEVEAIALEVERRQHGWPSGVDGAVVLRGGVQWIERSSDGALRFEALPRESPLLDEIRVLDTGTPEQATGEVVAAVRQLRDLDPDSFERLLGRLEGAARRLRGALASSDAPALADAIHEAERGLEALGVVPAPVRELVRRIEGSGGAAKVSGAGALRGPRAGSLVVYHPYPEWLVSSGLVEPRSLLPVRLGAEGVRSES